MKRTTASNQPNTGNPDTGLPWLRSWPAVYTFVLASFVLWLALLIVLTKVFS